MLNLKKTDISKSAKLILQDGKKTSDKTDRPQISMNRSTREMTPALLQANELAQALPRALGVQQTFQEAQKESFLQRTEPEKRDYYWPYRWSFWRDKSVWDRISLRWNDVHGMWAIPVVSAAIVGCFAMASGVAWGAVPFMVSGGLASAYAIPPLRWLSEKGRKALATLERQTWFRGPKVTQEISATEIAPALQSFDQASPTGQALLALVMEQWLENARPTGKLLSPAAFALQSRIKKAKEHPPEIQEAAGRVFRVLRSICGPTGEARKIEDSSLEKIKNAFEQLSPEELESLRPILGQSLFPQGRTHLEMAPKVLRYLSETLSSTNPDTAAEIEATHLVFGSEGKVQELDSKQIASLAAAVANMSPERATQWRKLIAQSYFDGDRAIFGEQGQSTIDLWAITVEPA